ncbi:RimK family alpha-L-glutamate ligase [Candidatus Woesearchaeota archaeon]|nr:RimK family alpha-L-glutamate ligase [Candidatus Woesearchaeota archaeon]
MKIWMLLKNPENYNINRFKEEAKKQETILETVSAEDFDIIATKEGRKSIYLGGKEIEELPDVLIPRMGSGTTYFALAVIRHLENLGVLVLNKAESIELAKDKLASLQHLAKHNLPIPKTMLAKFPFNMEIIKKEFSFPIIIKTLSGSLGKGVFLCDKKSSLENVMDLIESSKDSAKNFIFQEFISGSKGRDIRVIVIGGRPIGAMLREAKKGSFRANFSAGGKVSNFELNPAVAWLAVESAKLTSLDIAGVDILFDGENYYVCEVNSAPGFEGFEKATGVNVPKMIFDYIDVRKFGSE